MIETLINSKTRIKVLKLFLSHIDDRYYLRELERLLGESLSPLRRQLIKLTNIGILTTEEEANLKYYKLNKNFEGLEKLKEIVLESRNHPESQALLGYGAGVEADLRPDAELTWKDTADKPALQFNCQAGLGMTAKKQIRYDLALLSFISVFVLATAIFVVYTNAKNIKQVVNIVSNKTAIEQTVLQPVFKNTSS